MTSPTKSAGASAHRRTLTPPHVLIRDFLAEADVEALLDWAVAHEARFEATHIVTGGVLGHDTGLRRSLAVRDFDPLETMPRRQAVARFPALVAALKMSPVRVNAVELELVAHGDGAFYARHIDTASLAHQGGFGVRVVSAV